MRDINIIYTSTLMLSQCVIRCSVILYSFGSQLLEK